MIYYPLRITTIVLQPLVTYVLSINGGGDALNGNTMWPPRNYLINEKSINQSINATSSPKSKVTLPCKSVQVCLSKKLYTNMFMYTDSINRRIFLFVWIHKRKNVCLYMCEWLCISNYPGKARFYNVILAPCLPAKGTESDFNKILQRRSSLMSMKMRYWQDEMIIVKVKRY